MRRSKDCTFAIKNHDRHLGYKGFAFVNEIKIIEKLSLTPANVYDSQIDLPFRESYVTVTGLREVVHFL